ncbi:hypothetical protein ACFW04_014643 [Cataglyphis niger]
MQYESRLTSVHTNNNREDDDSIQFKFDTHSIQNHEDNKQIPMERTNSTNVNYKKNFTSQEIYENLMRVEEESNPASLLENSSKDRSLKNIVSYKMCFNITCIQLCCPLGDRLVDNKCFPEKKRYFFPNIYGYTNDSLQSENKTVDELFQLVVYDPCQDENHILLPDHNFTFFANGSLYLSYHKIFVKSSLYCLGVARGNKYEMTVCSKTAEEIFITTNNVDDSEIIFISFDIVCILFMVSIFLVYSILPELRNVHGFMLCNYSGALCVTYTTTIMNVLFYSNSIHDSICIIFAFFIYFCYMASFFWLTVMSFDMWWTFRGFCSLQSNIKQRKKKKLVFYTLFAWGLSFTFAIISIIMEFSENLPEILQPKFRKGHCWFVEYETFVLYFYGFFSICTIISICLSISAAVKIARFEKETGHCLTNSESQEYNNNKKWFNLYLKIFILLFIMMIITWSIMTSLLFKNEFFLTYLIMLTESLQNFCFFIIFVWKKDIRRMLLKRFRCVFCFQKIVN